MLLAIIFWYNTWQLCLVGFLGSPGRNNQTTSRTINLLSTNFWITDGGSPGWRVVLVVVPSIPRGSALGQYEVSVVKINYTKKIDPIQKSPLIKIFPDKKLTSHKPDPLFSKKFDQAKKWPTLKKFSTKNFKHSELTCYFRWQIKQNWLQKWTKTGAFLAVFDR